MACSRRLFAFAAVLIMVLSSAAVVYQESLSDAADASSFDAEVTPFTFPECKGVPILNTLKQAESSIDVSIYLLTSMDVLKIILDKAKEGKKVRITIEGDPVNMDLSSYSGTRMFKNIIDAGGEVHVINYKGCTSKTYTNFHNKYAVVDGKTVIITSENWTAGNFNATKANVGWGAIIKSEGYAQYMEGIFNTDFDVSRADVKTFAEVFPNMQPYDYQGKVTIGSYDSKTYKAKVTPAVVPDNASSLLKTFMNSATKRLYLEQLTISESYVKGTDNPYTWILEKSEAGVDTRLVLNTSYDEEKEGFSTGLVNDLNNNTKVIAAGSYDNGTKLIHNKGLVADDKVWLGSMNLTPDAMYKNREACVIIESKEIADYFSDNILYHLYSSYVPGGDKQVCYVTYEVDNSKTVLTYIKGDKVLVKVPEKKSSSIYTYEFSHWEGYTEGMVADHDITLKAVFVEHSPLGDNIWIIYVVAVLSIIAATSLAVWHFRHR